jgi:hypothetical protein
MDQDMKAEWRLLLRLLLSQRLEMNAIESVLTNAGVLTAEYLREIRTQASDTAKAWSAHESDDILTLLKVHSLPTASMRIAPPEG